MTSDWKEYTVQELIDNDFLEEPLDGNHGNIHPKSTDYVPSGIPFIMANDLKNGTVDYKNCVFITEQQANTLKKGIAKPGDVLLTHKATIGRTAIVPDTYDKIILTPQVTYYRVKNNINNVYLKYYFDSPFFQNTLINWACSGSTRYYLGILAQHKLPIILPPLETQHKIARVLGAIDDKIELNNSINKNLEQQMDLLYTNMFIDDTNFVELGSVIETTSGGTPSRKNLNFYKNGTINWIKSKELLGTYIIKTEEYITDEAVKKSSAKILPKQSVLVAMYGATVGAYGIISKEMTCNQAICALIQNERYPYPYIFETIKFAKNTLVNMAVGSAQQNISQILIKQLPVHSNLDKIKKYCNIAELLLCKILNIQEENERLTQLRDTLLPKLMNGEIDVGKVELKRGLT